MQFYNEIFLSVIVKVVEFLDHAKMLYGNKNNNKNKKTQHELRICVRSVKFVKDTLKTFHAVIFML